MKQATLGSLFRSIIDLFKSIYKWLLDDAKRMQILKDEYERKQIEKNEDDEYKWV